MLVHWCLFRWVRRGGEKPMTTRVKFEPVLGLVFTFMKNPSSYSEKEIRTIWVSHI
jgi:hypothetical protein